MKHSCTVNDNNSKNNITTYAIDILLYNENTKKITHIIVKHVSYVP